MHERADHYAEAERVDEVVRVTVVLCEITQAVDAVRARYPDLEVIDISQGIDEGMRGEVVFGGFGPSVHEAVRRGVQWVQLPNTGIDHTDPALLSAPLVTCARGAGAIPISEYVLATMLAAARRFPDTWLSDAPAHWNFQRTAALHGSKLAIVGFGGIGQRVARLALAFGMEVMAMRRTRRPSEVDGVHLVEDLQTLVADAHHLVLAAPATSATQHLLNDESFSWCTPGLHLVNIARGSLVDQDALRRALDDGIVARASLDVCDPEPLPAGHWLYHDPRVFLTPHSSWTGTEIFAGAIELFLDNLARYLKGEPLEGVIDLHQGY